ncbi:MAG: amino acid ABC transporter permease [Facklamia hominis]|uniref:amino acid ABC transporter permease n=1 Tax=Facklamia hominis TaxID=178214 RepID=UPI00288B7E38|nr:amino acid ABC transporter permease [Facklamia hominis]
MEREWLIFQASFWPILKAGLLVTLPLSLMALLIGMVIATLTALARLSKSPWLSQPARFYVWLIRGTPLLVQLFIVYFGLPNIGITLDAWVAGVLALSLSFGAYASESIRGALLSVPQGQVEAALSLGMSKKQVFFCTVLPQAVRIAVPPLMGNFIGLFKQTSLVSTVTIMDMMFTAQRYVSVYFETLLIYLELAVLYLIFTSIFTQIQARIEAYYSRFV